MIVYKLMRLRKDGTLGPLFINRRLRIKLGEWMKAEDHPTKGYAHRPGWHACLSPFAPHLSEKDRVWVKCEAKGYTIYKRPPNQGGAWVLAKQLKAVRILKTGEK